MNSLRTIYSMLGVVLAIFCSVEVSGLFLDFLCLGRVICITCMTSDINLREERWIESFHVYTIFRKRQVGEWLPLIWWGFTARFLRGNGVRKINGIVWLIFISSLQKYETDVEGNVVRTPQEALFNIINKITMARKYWLESCIWR